MPVESGLGIAGELAGKVKDFLPGTKYFVRVILPGAIATGLLYPFTGAPMHFTTNTWKEWVLPGLAAVSLGLVIDASTDRTYKVYEGLRFWPKKLFDFFTALQQKRVDQLMKKQAHEKDDRIYNKIWSTLNRYPLNEKNDPEARCPTLLGNILAGYESYPLNRYGMDSAFYWTRLWLQLDKEQKQEIDSFWSVADGLVSLSAVSACGGILWIIVAACLPQLPLPLCSAGSTILGGFGLVLLSYLLYRLSLPFHRKNGELYKAIFDLYRDKVNAMTVVGPAESSKWKGTWAYLQYLRVQCTDCHEQPCKKCNGYYAASESHCPCCGRETQESLEALRRTLSDPKSP